MTPPGTGGRSVNSVLCNWLRLRPHGNATSTLSHYHVAAGPAMSAMI